MNTEQQFKEYSFRLVEAINALDWEAYDKLVDTYVASEYIGHLPGVSSPVRGPEGMKQYYRGVFTSIPGYHATIEDVFVAGDKGAMHFTGYRTDPATGKAQRITGLSISHLKDGKFAEEWELVGEWEDEK